MNRRKFVRNTLAIGVASFISTRSLEAIISSGREGNFIDELMDKNDIIPAPDNPSEWKEWRLALHNWREMKQIQLKYDGSSYRSSQFEWITSDFACCFLMLYDSEIFDTVKGEYTPDFFISEGMKRYGGYDSVVLWHAYPRIGLDERNQFDFYRDMPQGLTGLNKLVQEFHRNNIKVFIDYNPWDKGTHRESLTDVEGLISIIKSIDADGVFLDTMTDAPDFREMLDAVKSGLVMEGEIALPMEHIESHHMSWAQGFKDSKAPGVYRNKWFERRHMQHAIDRWSNDKTAQLHTAWMNGSGIMIWENIFAQLNVWNERDKSIYRTMYSIQHFFHTIFSGDGWIPLYQESDIPGVYISLWEEEGIKLWTLVNRNEFPVEGVMMKVRPQENSSIFNLVTGEEINRGVEQAVSLPGNICIRGIASFASISKEKIIPDFKRFLKRQKELFSSASVDTVNKEVKILRTDFKLTKKYQKLLSGMVAIPEISMKFNLECTLNEVGSYGPIQDYIEICKTNKIFQPYRFTRYEKVKKIAIDETPVTNAMFKEFLIGSGYKPRFKENFLKHWTEGMIPDGKADHPVVYIDLNDARAYAQWAGKRLPTEFEWQFAAQGTDSLVYPWGNEMEENKCNQNTNGITTPVKAFPGGISPFGCYDMCGNTWELTESEHTDMRTRFVMLKGGSCFKAEGSVWYADGGPQKNGFLAKMLLLWPGLDRCSTIGFRCAIDM